MRGLARLAALATHLLALLGSSEAQMVISEVADKGSTGACGGEDWIEVHNAGAEAVTATGRSICDAKKCAEPARLAEPLAPGAYLLLCGEVDFTFGVGGDETVELRDGDAVVSTTTLGGAGAVDKTWALQPDGAFGYTTEPTPGAAYAGAGAATPTAVLQLLLSELSDKGSAGTCAGEDWVEVYNPGPEAVDLALAQLCDPGKCSALGAADLAAGGYAVLCKDVDFSFGLSEADVITLRAADAAATEVSATTIPAGGEDGRVWARAGAGAADAFAWSYTPTPGAAYAGVGTRAVSDGADSCTRLLDEQGLDCAACLDAGAMPAADAECAWTAAEDEAAEVEALFGGDTARALWRRTQFLWSEAAPIRDFELGFSEAGLATLMANPSAEEYVTGTVKVAGLGEWRDVGIRMKGYYGSLRICFVGQMECNKLSYKLKFNHVNATQTFFGLKKVQFHASIHDSSMLRERLAYSLWREMGVAAPRSAHAGLRINGVNVGLHLLTEVLDGRFTDALFDGGDGTLYKEVWPGMADPSVYAANMQTNEGEETTAQLEAFGAALNAARTDFELVQAVKKYTKQSKWARYMAVDRAVHHWDGPINFRVAGGGGGKIATMTHNGAGQKCFPAACREKGGVDDDCCAMGSDASCQAGYEKSVGEFCWSNIAYSYCCSDGTADDGSIGAAWTHNYFLYESEDADPTEREFELVAWDVDNVLPSPEARKSQPSPAWDMPVCLGGDAASVAARAAGQCTDCASFETGSGRQFPPSCFKMVRVFARGLRTEYMAAAQALLAGPLQPCRVNAKLDRWRVAIAARMAADATAGLYPATMAPAPFHDCGYTCCVGEGYGNCDSTKCTSPNGQGGTDCCATLDWGEPKTCAAEYRVEASSSWSWAADAAAFQGTLVPSFVAEFRAAVSCDRDYAASAWDALVPHADLQPILKLEDWGIKGKWEPPWTPEGKVPSAGAVAVVTASLCALVALVHFRV